MASRRDPAAEERERLERFLEWRRAVGRERRPSRWRWLANVAGILVLGVIVAALSSLLAGDLRSGRQRLATPAPFATPERFAPSVPVPSAETTVSAPLDTAPPDEPVAPLEVAAPAASDQDTEALELPARPETASRARRSAPSLPPPPLLSAGERPLPASLPGIPELHEQPRTSPGRGSVLRDALDGFDQRAGQETPPASAPATTPTMPPPLSTGPTVEIHVSKTPTSAPSPSTAPSLATATPSGSVSPRATARAAPGSWLPAPSSSRVTPDVPAPGKPAPPPAAIASTPEVTPKVLPRPVETLRRLIEYIPEIRVGRALARWMSSQPPPDRGQAPPEPRSAQTR